MSCSQGFALSALLNGLQRAPVSAEGLHQILLHCAPAPAQWEEIETYLTLPTYSTGSALKASWTTKS